MGNSGFKQRSVLILSLGENFYKKEFLQKNISFLSANNSTTISSEQNNSSLSNQSNHIKACSILYIKLKNKNYEKLFSFFISPHILISHLSKFILNNVQNIDNICLRYNDEIIQIPFKNIGIKNNIIVIFLKIEISLIFLDLLN